MRRSDLILYLGILILFLGLVSWFVSQDRTAEVETLVETQPGDQIPEIPGQPETPEEMIGFGENEEGLLAFARGRFEALRREGDRLADQVWKDGLSDSQRGWLSGIGDQLIRLRNFTLTLQFLLILVFTALLLVLYHLVSSGKIQRMLWKQN
jgi:hypothetical protein